MRIPLECKNSAMFNGSVKNPVFVPNPLIKTNLWFAAHSNCCIYSPTLSVAQFFMTDPIPAGNGTSIE